MSVSPLVCQEHIRDRLTTVHDCRSAVAALDNIVAIIDYYSKRSDRDDASILALLNTRALPSANNEGIGLLHAAVMARDVGALTVFLGRGALVNLPDRTNQLSPLMYASLLKGSFETVRALLQYGASVEQACVTGDTALSLAVRAKLCRRSLCEQFNCFYV